MPSLLKIIFNPLVGDARLVFVVPLKQNCLFIYVNVLFNIPAPLGIVADIIQHLCNIEQKLLRKVHGDMCWGVIYGE